MNSSLHLRILKGTRFSVLSLLLAVALTGISLEAQGRGNSGNAKGNQGGQPGKTAAVAAIPQTPEVVACALYPITFPISSLAGLQPGQTLDIYAGSNPGNFGWLSWAGSPNEPTIRKSLEIPGDSHTYVNPHDSSDRELTAGDWVFGSPGISNSKGVRDNLDALINVPILIPVYGTVVGSGRNVKYEIVTFAEVAIQSYRLPSQNRITAKFLGFKDCGGVIEEPPPPVNEAPVAEDKSLEVDQGDSIDILLEGSDPDGDSLTFIIVSEPANGTLVVHQGGLVEYTPKVGFIGEDSFSYKVSDGELESNIATVLLLVSCPNGDEGAAVFWSQQPSSIDGTVEGSIYHLTGQGFNLNSNANISGDILVPGTPNVNVNGTPNWEGVIEGEGSSSPSGYWITINSGATLRNLVTRTDPQALPVVTAPTAPSNWNWANINNASDPDPNWSQVGNVNFNSNSGVRAVPAGAYGSFNLNSGTGIILGTAGATEPEVYSFQQLNVNSGAQIQVVGPVILRLAHNTSFNGPAGAEGKSEWLRIEVNNGGFTANSQGQTIYAHVYAPRGEITVNNNSTLCGAAYGQRIRVNSGGLLRYCGPIGGGDCGEVNEPPVAEDVSASTLRNEPVEITLLGSDPDGDSITYAIVSGPSNGTLSLDGAVVSYTPATGFVGTDTFTYLVNDGELDSEIATVTVEVGNDAPVAQDISVTTPKNTGATITLVATDPNGDPLSFTIASSPSNGSLSLNGNQVTYTPNDDFVGTDEFTYFATDGVDLSNVATVAITVQNRAPSADGKTVFGSMNTSLDIILTGSDPDGDTITFEVTEQPANGFLSSLGDGIYEYTPLSGFTGVDTFKYVANDGLANSSPATVTINIASSNLPPVASNVSVETPIGVPVTVPLAATDPDGDAISFIVVSQPTNGTVVQVGGVVTYTPNSGFFGTDSFTYRATDGQLQSNQATASITVISATNQAPVANDLFYQVAPGGIIAIQYAGVDPDGDSLTYQRLNAPTGGVLFGATGSSVQFRAAPSFSGTTSFQYRAFDGALYSEPATVTIVSSTSSNLPPVVDAGENQFHFISDISDTEGNAIVQLNGSASDDGQPAGILNTTWTLVSKPAGAGDVLFENTASLDPEVAVISPVSGNYIFRLSASDTVFTATDTVTITLTLGNEPPVVLTDLRMNVDQTDVLVPLKGIVLDDGLPLGAPLTRNWEVLDWPDRQEGDDVNEVIQIIDAGTANAQAIFFRSGIYLLELSGDDTEFVSSDVLTVYVAMDCIIDLPQSAIAWWPANLSLIDHVERRHDANPVGGLTFERGASSYGFGFNGEDSGFFARKSTVSDVGQPSAGGFSFEAWVSPDSLQEMPILKWMSETSTGVSFEVGAAGQLIVRLPVVGGSTITRTYANVFTPGEWTHIGFVYNYTSGVLRIFKDGQVIALEGVGQQRFNTSQDIWVGQTIGINPGYFHGVMDEITIYRGVLSASEMQLIYASGSFGKCGERDNI